ncbi:hypothetical protein DFS33DRAFT_241967 [Desarmillaria ectypa]|nr:hypothetical protein DFS33DRAFT_241967 [Desarmillaria ectypa]
MPPKASQASSRSSGPAIPGMRGGAPQARLQVSPALGSGDHIITIGVKRTAFGDAGKMVKIKINAFSTTVPDCEIYQYDVGMSIFCFYPSKSWHKLDTLVVSSDKTVTLPARFNMELFELLQTDVAPDVFKPRAVYDGRKIAFTVKKLSVNECRSIEFKVLYGDKPAEPNATAP